MIAEREVKERPILFSGAMVRTILQDCKTQTRRVVKPQPHSDIHSFMPISDFFKPAWGESSFSLEEIVAFNNVIRCPYGHPGDRLWVRETITRASLPHILTVEPTEHEHAVYAADGEPVLVNGATGQYDPVGFDLSPWFRGTKLPCIHMPRWASRITLEIVRVRVERLLDISEADAKAEGAFIQLRRETPGAPFCGDDGRFTHRNGFANLWEEINGPSSWGANPWVWVVEFKRK